MTLLVEGLSAARGGRIVVDELTFTVDPGTALMLTGPNGAGKTTLLRTLAGFLAPAGGSVRLSSTSSVAGTGEAEASIAEQCHFVGHLDGVKGSLAVIENARFAAQWLGGGAWRTGSAASEDAIAAALDRVGLAGLELVPARFLSAGQRRRLALSRLLVAPRPLWLLDEPTASLDAAGQAMLAAIAGEHLAAGGIVVAATHLPLGIAGARELSLGAHAPRSEAAA